MDDEAEGGSALPGWSWAMRNHDGVGVALFFQCSPLSFLSDKLFVIQKVVKDKTICKASLLK